MNYGKFVNQVQQQKLDFFSKQKHITVNEKHIVYYKNIHTKLWQIVSFTEPAALQGLRTVNDVYLYNWVMLGNKVFILEDAIPNGFDMGCVQSTWFSDKLGLVNSE